MTLLDLPHGKTQINESQKFNATDRAAHAKKKGKWHDHKEEFQKTPTREAEKGGGG